MRMGRVLALVAGALVLCIAGLGLAIYFTRDEDNIQADNILSENFTKAVAQAPQHQGRVELPAIAPFEWDRVLIVAPGTPRAEISRRLGRKWTGIDTIDGGEVLIFRRGDAIARFANYRGSHRFEGFSRPFAELPRERAVLLVRDRVVRPA